MRRMLAAMTIGLALTLAVTPTVRAVGGASVVTASPPVRVHEGWRWPVAPVRIVRPYAAPAGPYGPGHRGIDLAGPADGLVHAPAAGLVAFVGVVADRPVITIEHDGGLVTTLEPVTSDLAIGDVVAGGDAVGTIAVGGHTPPGAVHFGVRRHGAYVNPMLLLGGVPRAVLLPCCG